MVLCILLAAGLPVQSEAVSRKALVIGNGAYRIDPLNNPVNDATDIAAALRSLGFEVDLASDIATRGQFKQKIKAFRRRLRAGDLALFYYAGHGMQLDKTNYLIPVGAEIEDSADLEDEAISAAYIRDKLLAADPKASILILDACRDNPFPKPRRGGSRGMARMTAPGSMLIASATQPDQTAADGDQRNSPYTQALLKYLNHPGLDIYGFFNEVSREVDLDSNGRQKPDIRVTWIPRDICLTGQCGGTTVSNGSNPHLTVKTSPERAKVRILNITQKYQPGMTLKAGRYQIEVSHTGYQRKVEWIAMGSEDTVHSVVLASNSPPPVIQPTPPPTRVIEELENGSTDTFTGMEFIKIQPGCFQMGSPTSESGRDNDETRHRVCLTQHYELGQYEVTQGQWEKVMGRNPSRFTNCGSNCPVENVSWDDMQEFIRKLNRKTGRRYRLPTEAEWEYAARAGSQTALYTGGLTLRGEQNGPELDAIAWYGGNSGVSYAGGYDCSDWEEKQYTSSRCGTHPVGRKRANAWGIYDMSGNVYEWVEDWYGDYPSSSVTDPKGPGSGSFRVYRGGSWVNSARHLRSANRSYSSPVDRGYYLGFRLARTL